MLISFQETKINLYFPSVLNTEMAQVVVLGPILLTQPKDSRIQRILFKKVQSVTYIRNMWFVTINFHIYNLLCKNQTTGVHDDISMIRH